MKHKAAGVAVALLGAVFLAVVASVLGFARPDQRSYPRFSTYRDDPDGASALMESLSATGVSVRRHTAPLRLLRGSGTTVLFLGIAPGSAFDSEIERLATEGARVVLAFEPPRREEVSTQRDMPLRVGVRLAHSAGFAYLDSLTPEWKVLRSAGDRVVAAERSWHAGVLVLLADSVRLSNLSVLTTTDSAEIARIFDASTAIVFDESHLGVLEAGSVAGLIRRYSLTGFVFAAIALAGLYIWSRSLPFIPLATSDAMPTAIRGQASAAGLVDLLERSIPPEELIEHCLREWKSGAGGMSHAVESSVEAAAAEVRHSGDVVHAWEFIRQKQEQAIHPWKRATRS